jgi:hypothetical protein
MCLVGRESLLWILPVMDRGQDSVVKLVASAIGCAAENCGTQYSSLEEPDLLTLLPENSYTTSVLTDEIDEGVLPLILRAGPTASISDFAALM